MWHREGHGEHPWSLEAKQFTLGISGKTVTEKLTTCCRIMKPYWDYKLFPLTFFFFNWYLGTWKNWLLGGNSSTRGLGVDANLNNLDNLERCNGSAGNPLNFYKWFFFFFFWKNLLLRLGKRPQFWITSECWEDKAPGVEPHGQFLY